MGIQRPSSDLSEARHQFDIREGLEPGASMWQFDAQITSQQF